MGNITKIRIEIEKTLRDCDGCKNCKHSEIYEKYEIGASYFCELGKKIIFHEKICKFYDSK